MEKHVATKIRELAIKAITDLTAILAVANEQGSKRESDSLQRPIANLIGLIETDLLADIYAEHPDLDDLA